MTDVVQMETKQDKEIRELAEYYAKLHKAMYDAHLRHGFTPEESLHLCCMGDPD